MTSVYNLAINGNYRIHTGTPSRPAKPQAVPNATAEDFRQLADKMEIYEAELARFHFNLSEFNRKAEDNLNRLRQDLEREFQTADHPRADQLWELAHRRGKYAGAAVIAFSYEELFELVK